MAAKAAANDDDAVAVAVVAADPGLCCCCCMLRTSAFDTLPIDAFPIVFFLVDCSSRALSQSPAFFVGCSAGWSRPGWSSKLGVGSGCHREECMESMEKSAWYLVGAGARADEISRRVRTERATSSSSAWRAVNERALNGRRWDDDVDEEVVEDMDAADVGLDAFPVFPELVLPPRPAPALNLTPPPTTFVDRFGTMDVRPPRPSLCCMSNAWNIEAKESPRSSSSRSIHASARFENPWFVIGSIACAALMRIVSDARTKLGTHLPAKRRRASDRLAGNPEFVE